MYEREISHEGLGKYRMIRGADYWVVDRKAEAQLRQWDDMWARRQQREQDLREKASKKELANSQTHWAQQATEVLQNTLRRGLMTRPAIEWDSLKDRSEFPEPHPSGPRVTKEPHEPSETDAKYEPDLSWINQHLGIGKQAKIDAAAQLFKRDHKKWEQEIKRVREINEDDLQTHTRRLEEWKASRNRWLQRQQEQHAEIDKRKTKYLQMDVDGILDYCDVVLSKSEYPDWFPQEYDLDYNPTNKMLIVEYFLPDLDRVPTVTEVRYIQSKDQLKEYTMADSALKKLYDDLIYQITLRTIYELYEADTVHAIDSLVFNGWVRTTDKSTGQPIAVCILSVNVLRQEFAEINLREVEPKSCFKKLKGVGSTKLHGMAAVPPIMRINREDSRFVEAYGVAHSLDESLNIAAMDWQDFEHLIREIFEKEFSTNGGEVKITRASRDHGVDGVAFDPDPIRGGKIVIQAKRYTNPVDVAAVRDLYGTVVNEGAMKGILVTTSDYGPDAYNFAKDKPLTLLNGSNLLHMLQKYGYSAKIDLLEAKKKLSE